MIKIVMNKGATMNRFRKRTIPVIVGLVVIGIAVAVAIGLVLPRRDSPATVPPGIVFVGPYSRETPSDLYRLSMDDSQPIPVGTQLEAGYINWEIAVSPDGQWIAFVRPIGRSTTGDLYRIRVDGSDQMQLVSSSTGAVAWSPDGEWIAYTEGYTSGHNVCLIRPDGSDQRCPTTGNWSLTYSHIAWSPDSFWIAFSHGTELWLIAADASELRFLERDAGAPVWSPDGEWIVFARSQSETIFRIRPDGSGLEQLVTGQHPAWSPDGAHIAFFSHNNATWFLNLLSLDDLSVRVLYSFDWDRADSHLDLSAPAWSPDGRWLAYIQDYRRLVLVPVAGGEVQVLDEYMTGFSWLPPVCQGACDVSFDKEYWAAARVLRTPTPYPTPVGTLTPTPGPAPCCDATPTAPPRPQVGTE
jgi:Tol biopolymer transport system component